MGMIRQSYNGIDGISLELMRNDLHIRQRKNNNMSKCKSIFVEDGVKKICCYFLHRLK